jgi:hypothetical protein
MCRTGPAALQKQQNLGKQIQHHPNIGAREDGLHRQREVMSRYRSIVFHELMSLFPMSFPMVPVCYDYDTSIRFTLSS